MTFRPLFLDKSPPVSSPSFWQWPPLRRSRNIRGVAWALQCVHLCFPLLLPHRAQESLLCLSLACGFTAPSSPFLFPFFPFLFLTTSLFRPSALNAGAHWSGRHIRSLALGGLVVRINCLDFSFFLRSSQLAIMSSKAPPLSSSRSVISRVGNHFSVKAWEANGNDH